MAGGHAGHSAPHEHAVPRRFALVGVEGAADGRADAVGTDQHVRFEERGAADAVAAVLQAHPGAGPGRVGLLDVGDADAGHQRLGSEALADGVGQDPLQVAAVDRQLGPAVAARSPALLAGDEGAAGVG